MDKKDKKKIGFISYDFLNKSSENLNIKNLNYIFIKHCLGINNFINTSNNKQLLNKKSPQNTNLIQDEWIIIDAK